MRWTVLLVIVGAACTTGEPEPGFDERVDPGPYGCGIEFCIELETCDGNDNDADGIVDEAEGGGPMSEWCESGCGAGARSCVGGTWSPCVGPEPMPETGTNACDEVDNDCDGAVDEEPFVGGDVLFLVDRSGSMQVHIERVVEALNTFAGRLGPSWRFALAIFPVDLEPDWALWSDFVSYAEIAPVFQRLIDGGDGGAFEASYDVLRAAATDGLGVTWRPEAARFLFLLTDEPGQSYSDPAIGEPEACGGFIRGEVVVSYSLNHTHFDDCGPSRSLHDVAGIGADIQDPCR